MCDDWLTCMFAGLALSALAAAVPLLLYWLWIGLT